MRHRSRSYQLGRRAQSDEDDDEEELDVDGVDVELDEAVLDSVLPFDEPPLSDEPDDESDFAGAVLDDFDPPRESLR